VRFQVNAKGGVGADFHFLQFIRGGNMEEVSDAFLTFVP
jgi:hypothetical protein